MAVRVALGRHDGTTQIARRLERGEFAMISGPDLKTFVAEFARLLELPEQKGGDDLTRQIGRAVVNPSVFIDPPLEKGGSVCPFFAQNQRPIDEGGIVDDERPRPRRR